jgi:hypothetical protein
MRRQGDRTMKTLIHAAVAVSVALLPIGYAEAAKKTHKSQKVHISHGIAATPGFSAGSGATGGNNANSMSGSNSAVENANGRTNCC